MNLEELKRRLKENRQLLDTYQVGSVYVFGSVATGKSNEKSDVDLLVDFRSSISLFEFIRLKLELEKLLGRQVDLVTADAIHPAMQTSINKEKILAAWLEI